MNLSCFIDMYGNCSFDEVPFTEIDNVILSYLSYLDFDGYVAKNRFRAKRFSDVGREFFSDYSKKNKNIYVVRKAIKLFDAIRNTIRYKDLLLYNYVYESGDNEQFSALSIEINNHLVYVSFEGTDQLVSGWKEDFMFSYCFPTVSQKKAISYVNKNFLFSTKKIILGGHSKGGNLALVSGMYANFFVKRKIYKIYNNDGPGLLQEQIDSSHYRSIRNRLITIIPNYSMVGVLLNNVDHVIVVRSMKKGLLSHDSMNWVVSDKEFERDKLSLYSKSLHDKILEWLDKYDKETIEKFVESLFSVFDRAGVVSIIDIFEHKKLILDLIIETKEIESDIKKMIRDFIFMIFKISNEVRLEEIKMVFQKKEKV